MYENKLICFFMMHSQKYIKIELKYISKNFKEMNKTNILEIN